MLSAPRTGPAASATAPLAGALPRVFAIVEEHAGEVARPVDRGGVIEAFVLACEQHAAFA